MTKFTRALTPLRCACPFIVLIVCIVSNGLMKTTNSLTKSAGGDETARIERNGENEDPSADENVSSEQQAQTSLGRGNATTRTAKKEQRRKNVLFIIVDDLRPQLGAYHDPEHPDYFSKLRMHTPNLDELASRSVVFTRAYAQYSLCGPSRTSLLTSRRPDTTRVYNNEHYWRDVGGNFTTLPQHFKNNGYTTIGLGKVFHPKFSSNKDDPPSWTEPYYRPTYTDRHYMPKGAVGGWNVAGNEQVDKVPLIDMAITEKAKRMLRKLSAEVASGEHHFFMGVGFNKPHVHIVCPERYFDLYPLEDEDNFLPNKTWQKPVIRPYAEFDGTEIGDGERILSPDVLRHFRRAYFACISYVDDLVGEILRELEELGLHKNTVVSFMADHGFHLGENRAFAKITTWEVANRVPMIIRIPGVTDSGRVSSSIVESVDIFPTLVEAAGLDPIPRCAKKSSRVMLCTQGTSLMPLLEGRDTPVKDAAYSQIRHPFRTRYTVRTKNFRLVDTAFVKSVPLRNGKCKQYAKWPQNTTFTELYDHGKDILEETNLVNDPNYRDIVTGLRRQLQRFVSDQLF
ncbi:hypothetical protein LSH36_258g00008 [Paralvinella palmiformis]|uniref:Sulfatase N-terminal domain-containing protein n=1 Tax=Paralvinella palmiformis TaxID=53620 RepID=A0AAD9N451_9ANNE|nr:hypothetical protein LSH36_258g00008 [Paralvinella palmiformis]